MISPSCPRYPALNGPGVLCEDFDTDRNGVPGYQFSRLPIAVDPNDPLHAIGDPSDDVLGYTQSTAQPPLGTGGRICSNNRGLGRLGCDAPVAEENDWHLHSAFEGPGAGYDPPNRPGIGAPDGGKAHGGVRSMHWGRHVNFDNPPTGDGTTVRYRQIAGFVLDSQGDPNIPGLVPGPGTTLEFWHLIKMLDDENAGLGFLPVAGTFGGGQIHISLLGANGKFDKWRPLSPEFNGYTDTINSTISICEFDPGDDQMSPTDDTMCRATQIMWADLGSSVGTDSSCLTDTTGWDPAHKDCGRITSCSGGPGCTETGSLGTGVWARTRLDLSPFAGRVARLRWVGSQGGGWSFGITRSALETGNVNYQYQSADDGWFLDDIKLTDLRQSPQPCGVDADGDGFPACGTDCDDNHATVYPGAPEICDGLINDCNAPSWPAMLTPDDVDNDGDGFSECQGDCNDSSAAAYPGATEICDNIDNDCDGAIDEGFDQDHDGFTTCTGDCDDTRDDIYPGAPQVCDGVNNNCLTFNWPSLAGTNEADTDGDGYTQCTGDCDDTRAAAWHTPGEALDLTLVRNPGSATTVLTWSSPIVVGGASVVYDLLRSPRGSDFFTGAGCLVSNTSSTQATDSTAAEPGSIQYILVRAENSCPAGLDKGPLGFDSNGAPRTGRSCP